MATVIQRFMKTCLLFSVFVLLSLRGYGQACTLDVTITSSGTTICSGNKVLLIANPTGGTAPYTYSWSTGETTQFINVNKEGTYKVSVSDKTPGCQPVTKSIDIIVSPSPAAPTVGNAAVCQGTSATFHATAPGGFYQWYDAPTGGNILATGDTYITPPINAGANYYVETTVNGCTSPRTAVFVVVVGGPTVKGTTVCAGNSATLTATGGTDYEWYDSASGGAILSTTASFTTAPLAATQVFYVAATVNGCRSGRIAVTAEVTPPPQTPLAQNVGICSGAKANLHADGPAGIFSWYDVPVGGTPLILSPDYTTPALTTTTTYYVQNSINGCESARAAVVVSVNPIPPAPAPQTVFTCIGTGITLTASAAPSGTYQWYDAPIDGNLLATGNNFTTPALNSSTNYYVQVDNGGCVSARSLVRVILSQPPSSPSVSGSIICSGTSTTLTAIGPGGNYKWYDAAVGGNLLASGVNFTTPALVANTTYYVETSVNGCTSGRTAVTVSILTAIPPPTASGTAICSGSSATLTATAPSNNYEWYDSPTGGVLLSSGQAYVTPALTTTTTYYVQTTSNGCTSARTAVTVTINPIPSPPTASGTIVCQGATAKLTASAPAGTLQWYDAATGGNLLAAGSSYTTPALNATTTYYVQNTVGQCISDRTPVTVSVTVASQPLFQYPSGSVCTSAANIAPVINDPAGGTFSSSPAGLVFVSNTTGEINVGASALGTYKITFVSKGSCAFTTTSNFSVISNPDAKFAYKAAYCQDEPNPSPLFSAGGTSGVFSATPAGLVFVNSSTGEIDLKQSAPGTYTISNEIAASGGCSGVTSSITITIDAMVTVKAGPNQTVPAGSPVQLAGSITGVPGGKWSGGTGSFSDPNLTKAVYTPGAGETTATLILTSADPGTACGPKTDQVVITFSPTPGAPTAPGTSVCMGSPATLSAIAPGGVYKWYDAATGGNLLNTGATYTTPPILADQTYYVETTIGGATSARTAVIAKVKPVPAAPLIAGANICAGSSTVLSVKNPTLVYEWYDAPVGGNLLSVSNTYTTPALTSDQSYYVQTDDNGCISSRTKVDVLVSPVPAIISTSTDYVCSGSALNYVITSDVPAATFLWSRAAVAGISNAAVSNQNAGTISEILVNTTSAAVNVTYIIIPVANGCTGKPLNYVVTVYPAPTVTGAAKAVICNGSAVNYEIKFNTAVTDFEWSRAAVAGIDNAAVSGQNAGTIKEALFNNSNAPVDVTYLISSKTNTCSSSSFSLVITVNPADTVSSAPTGEACSGTPQSYAITSNVPSATFTWKRDAVAGISNLPVSGQTSALINESLINTGKTKVKVIYTIVPVANGCPGPEFTYTVTVNPKPETPVANGNSPVCIGSTIKLRTPVVDNATYLWTGPNGFTSTDQNPDINASMAYAGTYTLLVLVNGCASPPATVNMIVKEPPLTKVGPDRLLCITVKSIQLAGSVTGGTTTGIWTTSGTGTFSPTINTLNAQYIPSDQDKASGSVILTLSSTSKDDCNISAATTTITFGPSRAADAGGDIGVCAQSTSVPLNGKILIGGGGLWSTSGTGTFIPSASQLNATYMPSLDDIKSGSVKLTLLATSADQCDIPSDDVTVFFVPPPTVNAGGIRYVLKNHTITLHPIISEPTVQYLWTPNVGISDNTVKEPVITGNADITYTLQVTDNRGCVSTDQTQIIVSPEITVSNTITPNGDGINDYWVIKGLIAYEQATVDIFNRYGQKIFHSLGYPKPWDGTYNGSSLPVGVYYYVIDTKVNGQVLSGPITIIK
jgi:gliding motility-associated-like protein